MSDTINLAKKTDLNAEITEIENKIPSITGLTTHSALTAVKNKIPALISLVKKTNNNTKISEVDNKVNGHNHDKYFITPEFNNLAAKVFNARLAQADLITKTDFDAKLQRFNNKINSAYFRGKNYFDGDGTQPVYKYFEKVSNDISSWKSKGLPNEKIFSTTATSNNKLATNLIHNNARIKVKFNGDFLKQNKVTYNHEPIVNIYIVYRLTPDVKDSRRF